MPKFSTLIATLMLIGAFVNFWHKGVVWGSTETQIELFKTSMLGFLAVLVASGWLYVVSANAIGAKNWVQKHPERMPILRFLLSNFSECPVDAACRRIRHVHDIFRQRRTLLSLPQLRRLAGIRTLFGQNPAVAKSLRKALDSLGSNCVGKLKSGLLFQEFHRIAEN